MMAPITCSVNVVSFQLKKLFFRFEAWPSSVTVPVLHYRSEIFCWWCPPPGRRRQTPPGWVHGGGLRFLASTVGTAKQNRHTHTHTHTRTYIYIHIFTQRGMQVHTDTHTGKTKKNTQGKQKMKDLLVSESNRLLIEGSEVDFSSNTHVELR